ncbi:flagellin [Thalassospira sp.]|uniref:flagellin n=1 Tax=Thalassospira sp. TaxID=1912094 RepID=UPI002733CA28|nr:flagellin [Thalassospira sp.]MDP2696657.1 flagellin [Thalassospira sp.]
MALNIISNYAANVAHRNLSASDEAATRSLAKLSSGTRVVSARDDAASMAIGARLNSEVQSLKTATVNVGQANSMLQIADGGMATIDNVLVRMKTLAVQASSGNLSGTERGFLDDEFQSLKEEMDRVSSSTKFNGIQLLSGQNSFGVDPAAVGTNIEAADGIAAISIKADAPLTANDTLSITFDNATNIMTLTNTNNANFSQSVDLTDLSTAGLAGAQTATVAFGDLGVNITLNSAFAFGTDITANNTFDALATTGPTSLTFQIGSGNVAAEDQLTFNLTTVNSGSLGVTGSAVDTEANAQAAIDEVSDAIDLLQAARSAVGVGQNRLDFAGQNLRSSQENNEAARSTLMDLDVAAEMTNFTSKQILVQSGVAMLAQANQMPQNLLRLLQ